MQIPNLYSRKWFQVLVFIVMLYAFIKTWFFDRKLSKYNSKFSSFEHFKLWAKYHRLRRIIDVVEILPNCGIPYTCPESTFPVHIYTGKRNNDNAKLCIMGRYLTNHAGNGGRGLNIALINSKRLEVKDFVTFDVYIDNSIVMDMWLNTSVRESDVLIIFTFDEASRMLAESSKKLFYDYGSSKVQDLHFRSQWYMVTQKGIQGFTPFEKVTMAHNGNWGDVIDERFCVPLIPVKVSPPMMGNAKSTVKEKFCLKHQAMKQSFFCNGMKKYDDISPAPLADRNLFGNIAYSVPIAVIMTESDHVQDLDSFTMTLESLIRQPGIDTSNVYVFYNSSSVMVPAIVDIFKFNSQPLNIPDDKNTSKCISDSRVIEIAIKTLGRRERYVIVLNSGLILSPDFLYFMSQLVTIVDIDQSLIGISAWNVNGYKTVSSNVKLIYRVQDYPSYGFLIRSDICSKHCKINLGHSCINISTYEWLNNRDSNQDVHILIPDVSRILWRPYPELVARTRNDYTRNLITTERMTNTDATVKLQEPHVLVNNSYFLHISELLKNSIVIQFSPDEIKSCQTGDSFPMKLISKFTNKTFSILYDEIDDRLEATLKSIANCFGIYSHANYLLGGSYYGVFRLTMNNNDILLVKSSSPLYNSKSMEVN
ncbi:protein O-linked-mannose beta-1,2-N-acetylglucosaminyltransferase 1-like [Planococcus citri]|uniref:protein O-linked-mannose beta-1,2-N-acetylglucosaminyltransferase 1-like n=1 Tax=Planococcus citri TaxID=170843 RepID=UPI0031F92C1D